MRAVTRFLTVLSLALMALVVACGGGGGGTPPPPPEPSITSFTASLNTIAQGASTNLTAVYANGTGAITPGVGGVPSGQPIAVSPTQTTTYILTVTNAVNATASRALTITVVPPISNVSFTAAKSTITLGESVALTATFTGGTAVVSNSAGPTTVIPVSGVPFLVSPTATTTYTLTVTNAAGATVTQGVIITVQNVPVITSFSANPATISQGASSTLNYTFSGGNGVINNGIGPVGSGIGTAVSPSSTTTYVLTVTNASGNTAINAVTVTVVGFPSNVSLTTDRPYITLGESAHLTATFTSGSAVITNSVNASTLNPVNGIPLTVSPAVSTTYILTVTNLAGGTSGAVATINVVTTPVITSFAGQPATITVGNSTNLVAVFAGGTGAVSGIGPILSGIPVRVSPTVTTSYLLTVTNAAGTFVQLSTTVKVVEAPTGISLVSIPPIITIGNSSRLIGTFTSGTAIVDNGVGAVLNGVPYLVTPPVTTTYTMTVTNPAGASATTGTVVTVVPPPSIASFTSNPPTPPPVAGGSPVQLLPVFANGSGFIGGVGSVISGNSYTVNPLETTTYTLTVTNPAGDFVTRILTVHVVGDPVIESFIAFPSTITAGDFSQLIGIFSGGNGVITAPPSGSSPPFPAGGVPVTSGVSLFVNPIATTTYTLTVTNAALVSVNRSVTILVVGLPTATSLTSSVNPITAGDTTFLTPTFSGGTAVITPGVGSVLSGSAYAVQPTQTTTYTLTVTNSIGATTGVVHTVVVLTGPNAAALAANPVGITVGGTSYLTAYFTIGTGGTASVVCTSPNAATSGLAAPIAPLNAVPFPVTPTAVGTYVYTLTVTNSAGVTSTHGVTVTVYGVPTAGLAITAGSNNPITLGETTSLTPTFTNGTGVIAGIGTVTSGQAYPVSPTSTTTYVLTVTNPVGTTATASLTVTVLAGPFAQAFYFQPNIITEGDTTQLYAIFSNATTAAVTSNGGAFLAPNAYAPTSGTPQSVVSAPVSAGIYTYTLAVTNATPTTYTTTTNLTVVPAPTAVLNVTVPAAFPYTITAGQSATLAPVFTNGTGAINNGVGPVVSGSSYVVSPTLSTTYTLTVTNAAGRQASASQTIFVVAGPFAQALVSDRLVATAGATIYLNAIFTLPVGGSANVTSSVATDTGTPRATPTLQTGVPFPVVLDGTNSSDRIFTLTADNGAGVTHTTGVLVKIVAAPTAVDLVASTNSINVGQSVTLTPNWTGGPDCVGVLSGGGSSFVVVNGLAYTFSPIATTTYVLTVTNGAGTSASDAETITVVQPPSITNFTVVPAVITLGGTSQLLTSYINGTASNLTGPAGSFSGAELPAAPASGTSTTVTPVATGTFIYTLVVTGPGGTATGTAAIRVVAPPVCTVTGEAAVFAGTPGHVASVPSQVGSTYNWNITNGTITAGQGTNQITYTAGTTTGVGVLTLTCTVVNAAGSSCTTAPAFAVDVNAVPPLTATLTTSAPADTISAGGSANLLPVFGGGINAVGTITPVIGTVTSGQAYAVSPGTTTTYTLRVTDSTGQVLTAVRTLIVVQPVTITSFTASRNPVTVGTVTNLTAVFSNPTPAVAGNEITHGDALGNPASPIVPTSGSPIPYIPGTVGTQTHTLTETNLAGQTVTRTLPIVVVAAPVATSLVAAPALVTSGQSSTLTPTFTDGNGVVSNGVGIVITGAGYPVTPIATTTYTLTVTNAAGDTAITQATVTVVSGPNAISLTASRRIITVGDSINLTALFTNGTAVNGLTGSANSFTGAQLPATPTSGTPVLVTPTAAAVGTTVTYSLLVTNAAGTTSLQTVTVDVVAAPTATLNASATTITAGESTDLQPIFTGGNGVINLGVGTVLTGNSYAVLPISTTVYQLTVTNAAGAIATAQRIITVLAGPLASSFTATPAVVTAGSTTSLLAIFAAGATGSIDNGVGAVTSGVPISSAALATTTTFTLTVTSGTITATRTVTVTVVPAPIATSLVATPATINAGQTSVLVPTFSNGSGTISSGVGNVVNGGSYNVTLTVTTTYTLAVTNAAGTVAITTATVTVLALPFSSSFTVSPAVVSVGDSIFMNWVFNLDASGNADILQTDDGGTVTTIYPGVTSPGTGTAVPVSLVVPPYGLYSYTLRLTQGTATVDTTRTVIVWELPTATITGPGPSPFVVPVSTPVPLTFTFTGNTTGRVIDGVGTTWTVANGDVLVVTSPATPATTRTYTLTVQNPAGTLATATFQIRTP